MAEERVRAATPTRTCCNKVDRVHHGGLSKRVHNTRRKRWKPVQAPMAHCKEAASVQAQTAVLITCNTLRRVKT